MFRPYFFVVRQIVQLCGTNWVCFCTVSWTDKEVQPARSSILHLLGIYFAVLCLLAISCFSELAFGHFHPSSWPCHAPVLLECCQNIACCCNTLSTCNAPAHDLCLLTGCQAQKNHFVKNDAVQLGAACMSSGHKATDCCFLLQGGI